MKCPKCGSLDTCRAQRKGWDQVFTWFNRWPYRCRACSRRFRGNARQAPYQRASSLSEGGRGPKGTQARQQAPIKGRIQVRTHPDELMAGIVVQAGTQSELNNILLTLGTALASYGKTNQPAHQDEKAWK
jgi:hypothetical protein